MAEVLLITALVLALFFIFFVRPARAVQGRRRRDLNALRIGDEVLTTGGILATVVAVETPPRGPMVLHLEIDEDVVVRAHTSAIEERLRTADEVAADVDVESEGDPEAARDQSSDDSGEAPGGRSAPTVAAVDPDDDEVSDGEAIRSSSAGGDSARRRAAGG